MVSTWAKFDGHIYQGYPVYAKVSLLYNVLWECIVVVYTRFVRSVHIWSSDPTCVQNFRLVPLMVFEILGFNLKNKNDNKNWRNRPFAISPTLVVQF